MSDELKKFRERAAQESAEILKEDIAGAKQWKRSKIGYLTGVGVMTDAVRSAAATLGDAGGRLKTLFRTVFSRSNDGVAVPEEVAGADERFVASMRVNGKTESDIRAIQDNSYRGFYLFAVMLGINLAFGVFLHAVANLATTGFALLDMLFPFFLVPLLTAMTVRWGYLNWIVRRRRLDSLTAYLRSGAWLPVKSGSSRGAGRALAVLAILIGLSAVASIVPDVAFAQTSGDTSSFTTPQDVFKEPSKDDYFMHMLSYIVPNVGPVPGFDGVDGAQLPGHVALARGFMAFSSTLLLIASALLAWGVLAGTIASAHEGKVLGQKWHQIWAPIRVTLGVGMLAPMAGGYCAAQLLVLYLVAWGGNLANLVWVPYVDALSAGVNYQLPASASNEQNQDALKNGTAALFLPTTYSVVRDVFAHELCFATVETWVERTGGRHPEARATNKFRVDYQVEPKKEASVWQWAYGPGSAPFCGKIEMSIEDGSTAAEKAQGRLDQARAQALSVLRTKLRGPAKEIAKSYQTPVESSENDTPPAFSIPDGIDTNFLRVAIEDYNDSVVKAVGTYQTEIAASNGTAAFATDAKRHGWATAGAYYLALSRLHGGIHAKATETPAMTAIDLEHNSYRKSAVRNVLLDPATGYGLLPAFSEWWDDNFDSFANKKLDPSGAFAGRLDAKDLNWFDKIFEPLKGVITMWHVNPASPLDGMVSFGHSILSTVTWIILGLAVAQAGMAAASAAGFIGGTAVGGPAVGVIGALKGALVGALGKLIAGAAPFIWLMLFGLLAVGAVHAFVLPLIPWIQTTFFVGALCVLVAESLVGSVLWALGHVSLAGQEMVEQQQKPGYMIAFNLLLRPVLMIFGLIMSFTIFGAMMWFTKNTFEMAMNVATGGHTFGPVTMIIMLVMLTYVHYKIAMRSFSLITQLPDRVTRWFGQGGENLGEDRDSEKFAAAVVGMVTHKTEGLAGRGGLAASIPKGGDPKVANTASQLGDKVTGGSGGDGGAKPPRGGQGGAGAGGGVS